VGRMMTAYNLSLLKTHALDVIKNRGIRVQTRDVFIFNNLRPHTGL